jgi:hypothetical protein
MECYEACYSHNIHEFIGSWQGSPSALVVKWADTEKERQALGTLSHWVRVCNIQSALMLGLQEGVYIGIIPFGCRCTSIAV